jgi:hypothetical protein
VHAWNGFGGSRTFGSQGLGFTVQSSGFRVQSSEFLVWSVGFRFQGSEIRVSGFRVQGSGLRFSEVVFVLFQRSLNPTAVWPWLEQLSWLEPFSVRKSLKPGKVVPRRSAAAGDLGHRNAICVIH